MTENTLIRIYDTPKGPHVYFGDLRVHHWAAGLGALFIGTFGLFLDKQKDRRFLYALLCIGGFVAFLDDLSDFLLLFEDAQR